MNTTAKISRFRAMLGQRCPRCRQGKIFRNWIDPYKNCPACQMPFERERGYYIGAMYFSYALSIVFISLFMLLWYLVFPNLGLWWLSLLACATFLPFVPMIYRYSRVIWMHFDRWAW